MRRLEVAYREEAIRNIQSITDFLLASGASQKTISLFVERLMARCMRIGDVPYGGRAREDLAAGLRTVPFEHSAVIAYVVFEDRVDITGVFYGGRDYEALYLDEEGP